MSSIPLFPAFKPLELGDLALLRPRFTAFQPRTSELTFTNLFIWRGHYDFSWCIEQDHVLVTARGADGVRFGFPPIGPEPRVVAASRLLQWLAKQSGNDSAAVIERADRVLAEQIPVAAGLAVEPIRDHFDYVYRVRDLIDLAGRKYHSKRNHLNKFRREHRFRYQPLAAGHLDQCLALADNWCRWRRCDEDLSLAGEWDAVREALTHFDALGLEGGAIFLEDRLQAFAVGEWLNPDTAVIHVEKANPEFPGLYPLINQQFCEHSWASAEFVNREQDLGEPGLRQAKESYFPDHLVEKFRIRAED